MSDIIFVRIMLPTNGLESTQTKKFKKTATVQEVIDTVKLSLHPCLFPQSSHQSINHVYRPFHRSSIMCVYAEKENRWKAPAGYDDRGDRSSTGIWCLHWFVHASCRLQGGEATSGPKHSEHRTKARHIWHVCRRPASH